MAVKGDTGKKGKLRYERWYAEIKGFALEEDLLEEGTDEIDVSHLPGTAVTVCWFHAAEEPLKLMPVTTEDGDLTMMRRALCEEAYLFGDVICEIAISTITGRQRAAIHQVLSNASTRPRLSNTYIRAAAGILGLELRR